MEYRSGMHLTNNMRHILLIISVIALTIGCQNRPAKKPVILPLGKHFPNPLVNKKFKTEQLIGFTSDKFNYPLIPVDSSTAKWSGNVIKFIDSVHFISSYEAWCGNDCFTKVHGRYYFTDSLKVRFYTDTITYSGECRKTGIYTKAGPPLDLYLVKGTRDRWQLNYSQPIESIEPPVVNRKTYKEKLK